MALFYSVAFARDAPDLRQLVNQVATEWDTTLEVLNQQDKEELVLQDGNLLLALSASNAAAYYELSFGEYPYKKRWHVTLGKEDTVAASFFLLQLVGKVALEFTVDFLVLFNGELVLLKKEAGKLYLNTATNMWENPLKKAIFQGIDQEAVCYPVNF
ncbi:MAG: hypothetical protein EOO61_20235 [Hymenobacter sp.]|nr:MAG: hypothetical protein EOO61_20235 [Hymenobacter sp.]